MQIIITGGAGFLGQKLAKALIHSSIDFDDLLLVDQVLPDIPQEDQRIKTIMLDLTAPGACSSLINTNTGILFHLAAIVSSQAEKEFDLGWRVNLDITRNLLEACRQTKPGIKFIFTSSLAVYGGSLPRVVDDSTALTPQSSYGTQKAIGELLVHDYTRKKMVDGRSLRLPTISIRPGRPNPAASSFVSSIIREPIKGEEAICPVSPELPLWLSSPDTVIHNIIHAATLDSVDLGTWSSINLPGLGITVNAMLDALEKIKGKQIRDRVVFKPDPHINNIVSSWPGIIDNTRALQLGFKADDRFEDFITQFVQSQTPNP